MSGTPWSYRIQRLAWSGVDLLFPPMCGGCGKFGQRWCHGCQSRVLYIDNFVCQKCGIQIKQNHQCEKCTSNPPVYRMMRSWAVFDSPIQNALHSLKYRRNVGIGDAIAAQLTEFVLSLGWEIDLLISVPLGRRRQKEKGYNQVGLVGQPLAYEVGLQYAPSALWKFCETRSQVGLSIDRRRENVY